MILNLTLEKEKRLFQLYSLRSKDLEYLPFYFMAGWFIRIKQMIRIGIDMNYYAMFLFV